MEDTQVDMPLSPEQSRHGQGPMMGAERALEGPGGRRELGMQRLDLVLRMTDMGQHRKTGAP